MARGIRHDGEPRVFKVTGSYGVKDYFRYYRKTRPKDKKYILTESQFYTIMRSVNRLLTENLIQEKDFSFPENMGSLATGKIIHKDSVNKDGKLVTNRMIDWNSTFKWWESDPEANKIRKVLYYENPERIIVCYRTKNATYVNKCYFQFFVVRELKGKISRLAQTKSFFDSCQIERENANILKLYRDDR